MSAVLDSELGQIRVWLEGMVLEGFGCPPSTPISGGQEWFLEWLVFLFPFCLLDVWPSEGHDIALPRAFLLASKELN